MVHRLESVKTMITCTCRTDCHLTCGHLYLFHEILNRSSSACGIFNLAEDTGYVQYFLRNLQPIPNDATNIQIIYSGQVGGNKLGEEPPIGHLHEI